MTRLLAALLLVVALALSSSAQVSLPWPGPGKAGAGAAACTYPVDSLTSAPTGIFSMRKVRSAYAGNALQVRRASDNATQNIGFSGGCNLDTASMLTFCAATNCFVATWYDQSGNARNFTQATAANQPQIVASGALLTALSSKGTMQCNGSTHTMTAATLGTFINASNFSIFYVVRWNAGGAGAGPQNDPLVFGDTFNYMWSGSVHTSTSVANFGQFGAPNNVTISVAFPFTAAALHRYDGTGPTIKAYIGGGTANTVTTSDVQITTASSAICYNTNSQHLDGYIAELYLFNVLISVTDSNLLGNDAASYWGTTWSNISS